VRDEKGMPITSAFCNCGLIARAVQIIFIQLFCMSEATGNRIPQLHKAVNRCASCPGNIANSKLTARNGKKGKTDLTWTTLHLNY
jgi:hypothetical protein